MIGHRSNEPVQASNWNLIYYFMDGVIYIGFYLKTNSLSIPFAMHLANNFYVMSLCEGAQNINTSTTILAIHSSPEDF